MITKIQIFTNVPNLRAIIAGETSNCRDGTRDDALWIICGRWLGGRADVGVRRCRSVSAFSAPHFEAQKGGNGSGVVRYKRDDVCHKIVLRLFVHFRKVDVNSYLVIRGKCCRNILLQGDCIDSEALLWTTGTQQLMQSAVSGLSASVASFGG
jgi:hypothetical protein